MSKPINLSKDSFEQEVLKSDLPVLVDFWAEWCGPCRMMAPVLDELAEKLSDKIKIVKFDVNNPENHELAEKYHIQSIPALKVFKEGKVVKEIVGYRPAENLQLEIEEFVK